MKNKMKKWLQEFSVILPQSIVLILGCIITAFIVVKFNLYDHSDAIYVIGALVSTGIAALITYIK